MNPHCLGDYIIIRALVIRWSNRIFFTIILDAADNIDIGLYPDVRFFSFPGFRIGVILAVFRSSGSFPLKWHFTS